jgi:hypothetical protein
LRCCLGSLYRFGSHFSEFLREKPAAIGIFILFAAAAALAADKPNIDRITDEGMRFTDYYADQSCTAGRSTFITGQSGLRTGLTKVGLPGAELGLRDRDITIAEVRISCVFSCQPKIEMSGSLQSRNVG